MGELVHPDAAGTPAPVGSREDGADGSPATGDAVVDAAIAALDALPADAPMEEHERVLVEVHEALQRRLSLTQA